MAKNFAFQIAPERRRRSDTDVYPKTRTLPSFGTVDQVATAHGRGVVAFAEEAAIDVIVAEGYSTRYLAPVSHSYRCRRGDRVTIISGRYEGRRGTPDSYYAGYHVVIGEG